MRATRRRQRTIDPLASLEAVRSICDRLRARLPDLIPTSEKQLMRFLYAVRHVERRPATDTLRGRPSRWPREKLTETASALRGLLERETSGRISVSSFIGQYLPLLQFPSDVNNALTSERLGCSPQAARSRRAELLKQHLAIQGSQIRLRVRVRELLGEVPAQEV